MNIAVTAVEPSLDARVEPRFGRCPYFLIVDAETLKFEAVENSNAMLGGGAGIQSAQLMAERNVKHVLTGNCGPNAYQTLSAAGIGVIIGCSGVIRDVVEQFNAGRLQAAERPNVDSKFGVSGATNQQAGQQPPMTSGGMGMGGGGGRGMGGGGRGMGGGMGRGQGMGGGGFVQDPVQQPSQSMSKDDELAILKQQAEAMAQQMQQLQQRITQLGQEGS